VGLVGLLSVTIGGLPLTLTASGGALVMGLVFGWLRAVHPTFGRIPEPAIWVFDTVGLTVFMAVVGPGAGPSRHRHPDHGRSRLVGPPRRPCRTPAILLASPG
jgi:uncharacterized transporter YbjL